MLAKIEIEDYMTKDFIALEKDEDVFLAIKQLLKHKQTSAPVLDKAGKFVGIFSEKDCIDAILDVAYNQSKSGRVAEFMSTDTNVVDAEASILDIVKKFKTCSERLLPVFKEDKLVGVVSGEDLLKALTSVSVSEKDAYQ